MSGRTVHSAIALLIIGNLMAIVSDALIKQASGELAIFQFVAIRLLFTLLLLLPFLSLVDRNRFWAGTRVHLVRAHVGLAGVVCMVFALGALPLATANAIFYVAPVLVVVLAVLFFGERLSWTGGLAVLSGMGGVLVILRPTELSAAGLVALGLAVALAVNALLVRKLPKGQTVVHSLLLNYLLAVPAALLLAIVEGAPLDLDSVRPAFGSALFILAYNATIILAYRQVDANQVTASEYTGILWAVLVGWLWFGELPDALFWIGTGMIVLPLFLQALVSTRPAHRGRPATQVGGSRRATDRLAFPSEAETASESAAPQPSESEPASSS
ncbi:DMT family transporter [Wenzhouxiangella marina]|uniref:DMT family transporter n=1 Tax=Wenzhouxiangella marina TaxID=1579979 RepID=UPI0009E3EBA3|nr:DMT family transporter [Wenzhouxiangella marina]MBB6088294.1 drug/metabolite transporter (DMT)-like permease [Wenzhouxiangella marina]